MQKNAKNAKNRKITLQVQQRYYGRYTPQKTQGTQMQHERCNNNDAQCCCAATNAQVLWRGLRDGLNVMYPIELILASGRVRKIMKPVIYINAIFTAINVYIWYLITFMFQSSPYICMVAPMLWTLPMYPIVGAFNYTHQTQTLALIYKAKYKHSKEMDTSPKRLVTESIYGFLLMLGLLLQIEVVKMFAPSSVSGVIILPLYCWFFAFYMCEFKLIYFGKNITARIQWFERRWLYFLSYGFPLAFVYWVFPFIIASGIYYYWTTLLIINTVNITPTKHVNIHPNLRRLPVFCFAKRLTMHVVELWLCCTASTASTASAASVEGKHH